jgi:hypothetical protein
MADPSKPNPSIPPQLFHTVLTVVHHRPDTSGPTQDVHVLGTHTTLAAAKSFALSALQQQLGYQPDNLATYATRADTQKEEGEGEWPHGDSVVVYANSPRGSTGSRDTRRGQEFLVSVEATPNTESLRASDIGQLHYVLRSGTDYSQDKHKPGGGGGVAFQETEIRGCYATRDAALAAARKVLVGEGGMSREEYAQYDEREGDDDGKSEEEKGDGWPFGEDVYVHAVAVTGEHYIVEVKTPSEARRKYGKWEGGGGMVDEADVFSPECG